jgi:hypothetical protein
MDESGTHGGPVIVLGGYLTDAAEWKRLGSAWMGVLKREGLKAFHAKDCMAQTRDFENWDWKRADRVYKELISIIDAYNLYAVAIAIVTADFRTLISPEMREQIGDEYHIAIQKCFGGFANLIRNGTAANELIAYVFEEQQQFRPRALEIFREIVQDCDGERTFRLGSMDYGDRLKFAPLQTADIIVYETYREMDRRIGQKYDMPNSYFDALTAKGAHYLGFFENEEIAQLLPPNLR